MSCDVLFFMFPLVSMFFVVHVCLIMAVPMYITRGQVALQRARLDLLSTRTSNTSLLHLSCPAPLVGASAFYTQYTILSMALIATPTLAVAIGFFTPLGVAITILHVVDIYLVVIVELAFVAALSLYFLVVTLGQVLMQI